MATTATITFSTQELPTLTNTFNTWELPNLINTFFTQELQTLTNISFFTQELSWREKTFNTWELPNLINTFFTQELQTLTNISFFTQELSWREKTFNTWELPNLINTFFTQELQTLTNIFQTKMKIENVPTISPYNSIDSNFTLNHYKNIPYQFGSSILNNLSLLDVNNAAPFFLGPIGFNLRLRNAPLSSSVGLQTSTNNNYDYSRTQQKIDDQILDLISGSSI